MNDWQSKIREFHRGIGQPMSPAQPRMRDPKLRALLIIEEAIETVFALVGTREGYNVVQALLAKVHEAAIKKGETEPDLARVIDGVVDTIFVCAGTAEDIGVDLDPFYAEVSAANMRKLDGPVDPLTGKKGKPAGWTGPDIAGLLAKISQETPCTSRE